MCPHCSSENLPGDKFCGECGHGLKKQKKIPSIDYSAPQSYTPKHLADKILKSKSSIIGERKLVTVLFADVANYTSMSEKLDPESVHQIMDGCFKILMDEIHGHKGTINQFTGDGVMALFGAPLALEDHAQGLVPPGRGAAVGPKKRSPIFGFLRNSHGIPGKLAPYGSRRRPELAPNS